MNTVQFLLQMQFLIEKSNKLDEARIDAQITANRDEIQQLREKNNVKHQLLAECERVSTMHSTV